MNVTSQTIRAIEELRLTNLESQIVGIVGQRLGLGSDAALALYYSSELSDMIERNEHGLQFLDASYLAEEVIRRSQ